MGSHLPAPRSPSPSGLGGPDMSRRDPGAPKATPQPYRNNALPRSRARATPGPQQGSRRRRRLRPVGPLPGAAEHPRRLRPYEDWAGAPAPGGAAEREALTRGRASRSGAPTPGTATRPNGPRYSLGAPRNSPRPARANPPAYQVRGTGTHGVSGRLHPPSGAIEAVRHRRPRGGHSYAAKDRWHGEPRTSASAAGDRRTSPWGLNSPKTPFGLANRWPGKSETLASKDAEAKGHPGLVRNGRYLGQRRSN